VFNAGDAIFDPTKNQKNLGTKQTCTNRFFTGQRGSHDKMQVYKCSDYIHMQ
jgi:hypothetical protein